MVAGAKIELTECITQKSYCKPVNCTAEECRIDFEIEKYINLEIVEYMLIILLENTYVSSIFATPKNQGELKLY